MKYILSKNEITAKNAFLPSLANKQLCSTCLYFLLSPDIFDDSGICFGPGHSTKQFGRSRVDLKINPIQADIKSITSRNSQVEQAYRNQIKNKPNAIKSPLLKDLNNQLPINATFCNDCVKKKTGGRPRKKQPEIIRIEESKLRNINGLQVGQ